MTARENVIHVNETQTVRGARSPRSGLANKPKAKAGSPRPSPVRRLRHSRVGVVPAPLCRVRLTCALRCAPGGRAPRPRGAGGTACMVVRGSPIVDALNYNLSEIRRWRFPILRGPCHISAETACYTRKRGPCLRHGTSDTSSPTNGVVLQSRWHADEASGPLRTGHCGCTWLGASLGRHE